MRRSERGFTLLETLVALAVFSLGALALLNLIGLSGQAAGAVERHALAGVVADNRAVEALTDVAAPPFGRTSGEETAGDRRWRWTRTVVRTGDPGVMRIEITVEEPKVRGVAAQAVVLRGAS
jgi:general secretion pathway protein I